ncbi:hypothetical protein [Brevundimonas sp. M20]|jgi:hypothetical protein|uniref:hypothetical protein n=1 Tax=Brevundimonas sp. M20 TaxID=2591463 RepID=UPI0011461530|nr:hypothetical protein [Brevundimonas sp. M20]QDH73181.1 hypothetical protein FKQ52_06910 [Brevundimonas sp. M20]
MIRALALSGLMLTASVVGGCTFRPITPEVGSPMGDMDRAERARDRNDRNHPACRDDRSERDDQPDGCDRVVRRDR